MLSVSGRLEFGAIDHWVTVRVSSGLDSPFFGHFDGGLEVIDVNWRDVAQRDDHAAACVVVFRAGRDLAQLEVGLGRHHGVRVGLQLHADDHRELVVQADAFAGLSWRTDALVEHVNAAQLDAGEAGRWDLQRNGHGLGLASRHFDFLFRLAAEAGQGRRQRRVDVILVLGLVADLTVALAVGVGQCHDKSLGFLACVFHLHLQIAGLAGRHQQVEVVGHPVDLVVAQDRGHRKLGACRLNRLVLREAETESERQAPRMSQSFFMAAIS